MESWVNGEKNHTHTWKVWDSHTEGIQDWEKKAGLGGEKKEN